MVSGRRSSAAAAVAAILHGAVAAVAKFGAFALALFGIALVLALVEEGLHLLLQLRWPLEAHARILGHHLLEEVVQLRRHIEGANAFARQLLKHLLG